ncbi:ribosome assembly factor SBDS [Candidatus Woesearchaeota archaeon]|nr:MAG: ribosome assembly factor SBDS [Candidatus Woesearchaeota archaeon]
MVDIDKAVIARLTRNGETFEILVDCDKALELKEGKIVELDDVLATTDIFKDVKKDEKPTQDALMQSFGTLDEKEIALEIIKKGEIQLTAEHKNKLRDEKKKRIIELLHRNAIDPKTGLPHPLQRIEMVMDEARVKVDEFKSPEAQVKDVAKKLMELLPLRFEVREVAIKLPANVAGKSYPTLKKYGKLLKDEWQNDGSLVAVLEIPAGLQPELEDDLNKLSQGDVEIKILNKR